MVNVPHLNGKTTGYPCCRWHHPAIFDLQERKKTPQPTISIKETNWDGKGRNHASDHEDSSY